MMPYTVVIETHPWLVNTMANHT